MFLMFLLASYFIMLTYNNSIPKMNHNWKIMSYNTAMLFTLFVMLIFNGNNISFNYT
jgi:hypothetical protein